MAEQQDQPPTTTTNTPAQTKTTPQPMRNVRTTRMTVDARPLGQTRGGSTRAVPWLPPMGVVWQSHRLPATSIKQQPNHATGPTHPMQLALKTATTDNNATKTTGQD